MKKSLIWILTIVMAITFGALLYFQVIYLENMIKMREGQFSEAVMRSLLATSSGLERQETLHYLQQDAVLIESGLADELEVEMNSQNSDLGKSSVIGDKKNSENHISFTEESFPPATQNVGDRYGNLQMTVRRQYLYQRDLLNEIIMDILHEPTDRTPMERADSTFIRNSLTTDLANSGLNVPFSFAVTDMKDNLLYSTDDFSNEQANDLYSIVLFPNSEAKYQLKVAFPTKKNYIFSSVRFIIPTLALSLMLFVIFVLTIVLMFRQKRITEMKTDFINNMTHELKTPVSTISLAAQMLGDKSVRKSQSTLDHLSEVIIDESKRLRFQVDKVLQMSILDNSSSALKFTEIDIDDIILNVVNTFKIKAEKFGGSLTCKLEATDTLIKADEMQFTNVIFSLLDNAIKYRKEDVAPRLEISTRDLPHHTVEIRVADNGIGISKDNLKRIFDKFYRVSTGNLHDVKGFGLGLAYVKKMVTIFEGSIVVESEPGVGSVFIIRLPAVRRIESNI